MHHSIFAGAVIDSMARSLLVAHNNGFLPPVKAKGSVEGELPDEYLEFERLKKIGMPPQVIISQMIGKNLDPNLLFPETDDYNHCCVIPSLEQALNSSESLKSRSSDLSLSISGPYANDTRFHELLERRRRASDAAKAISEEFLKFRSKDDKFVTNLGSAADDLLSRLNCVRPEDSEGSTDHWDDEKSI